MKRILVCIVMLWAATVHANEPQACGDGIVDALASAAHVSGVVVQTCKAMPDDPHTLIAVAAFDAAPAGSDQAAWDQVIALVDTASHRVLAINHATVEEDAVTAVGPSSYEIDTARYRLAPHLRAFGVVFHSAARGASCPDAWAGSELTLWVNEGRTLRPVLGTNLDGWVAVKGEACGAGHGEASSAQAHITLAMEKTTTRGYADISLTAHITPNQRMADGSWRDGPKRTEQVLLKYDGTSYGDDMFRTFWYPTDSAMR